MATGDTPHEVRASLAGTAGAGADPAAGGAPATWGELLRRTRAALGSAHDARRILERASGRSGAELAAAGDEPAPWRARAAVSAMVERRRAGAPLQYVVGAWGFRTLDLLVDGRVLIPRPETEQVVDVALGELRRLPGPRLVVDLGTGSGAVALSVAVEVPGVEVWATDASPAALEVARANLAGLGRAATRVRLALGSWFEALPGDLRGRVDLIVSNPPYVAESDPLPAEVADWEPRAALVAGPTGLEAVTDILGGAPGWLRRPGTVVLEIAPHQAERAVGLAERLGYAAQVHRDLAGRDRALVARL